MFSDRILPIRNDFLKRIRSHEAGGLIKKEQLDVGCTCARVLEIKKGILMALIMCAVSDGRYYAYSRDRVEPFLESVRPSGDEQILHSSLKT